MTILLLSPENNHSSIEGNPDSLINSTLSTEEAQFLSSVNFRCSNPEHVDINLRESITVRNHENETSNINNSISTSKGTLRCEKSIRNLKPIKKMWTLF